MYVGVTVADGESDISDVEQEGYCEDTTEHNVFMRMRVRPVEQRRVKRLYKDSKKVGRLITLK